MRKKRPRSKLTGVHGDLADILGEASLQKLVGMGRLRRAWPDIVGPMMAKRTEPMEIQPIDNDGLCLWVAVDHSIMAQQIRFLRDEIRKACFKHAGISNLHKISTRLLPGAGIAPAKEKPKARPLSFAEKRRLALDVAAIKDRQLRKAAFKAHLAEQAYRDK